MENLFVLTFEVLGGVASYERSVIVSATTIEKAKAKIIAHFKNVYFTGASEVLGKFADGIHSLPVMDYKHR